MWMRGKARLSRLKGAILAGNGCAEEPFLIHSAGVLSTATGTLCGNRSVSTLSSPREITHPPGQASAGFTSTAHPLYTNPLAYPRKTSTFARFRCSKRGRGRRFHILHGPL